MSPGEGADFIKRHWKVLAIGGGVIAGAVLLAKLGGGGGGVAASTPAPTATTQQPAVTQSDTRAALEASTTINLAQFDATTYIATVQSQGQVAAQALAAASTSHIADVQALSQGFSSFVVGTAQEVAATAGAIAGVAKSNNEAGARMLAATGQLLAGAGSIVSQFTGTGINAWGASSSISQGLRATQVPMIVIPGLQPAR